MISQLMSRDLFVSSIFDFFLLSKGRKLPMCGKPSIFDFGPLPQPRRRVLRTIACPGRYGHALTMSATSWAPARSHFWGLALDSVRGNVPWDPTVAVVFRLADGSWIEQQDQDQLLTSVWGPPPSSQEVFLCSQACRGHNFWRCWECGRPVALHKCRRCGLTRYCGPECQTLHWPMHQHFCWRPT